jgi:hypothetical protein
LLEKLQAKEWQEALQKAAGKVFTKRPGSAIVSEQARVPLFEGWLTRAGQGAFNSLSWRRQYFVLRRGVLFFYENDKEQTIPAGFIPLFNVQVEKADYIPGSIPHSFVIDHAGRKTFLLAAENAEAQDRVPKKKRRIFSLLHQLKYFSPLFTLFFQK